MTAIVDIEKIARAALKKKTAKHLKSAMGQILNLCREDVEHDVYRAWTDGACHPNPGGVGGYAFILKSPDGKTLEGGGHEKTSTNNRMEIQAAIVAIAAVPQGKILRLRTDSQYLQKGISEWIHRWRRNGWKTSDGGNVKNQDLWQALESLSKTRTVIWIWVKAHAGNAMNERADELARAYAYGEAQ